ncbi:MAG TPA: isoaspartyl peptidase/L-asparaginase [Planctomycetota bacterium]|nr:isoaspartyl peptidase/L-asparaginase [Planctomycetota bacterium]
MRPVDRRQFLGSLAAAGAAASAPARAFAIGGRTAKLEGPGAIGSSNAHHPSSDAARSYSALARAVERMRAGDKPIDAAVSGVHLVEDDPLEDGVGLGGLPNEEGVVELDASVMDGTEHRAGAVGGLRNIQNPSAIALAVMRRTNHLLLVGDGAFRFARDLGYPAVELLTPASRERWLEWRAKRSDRDNWLEEREGGPTSEAVKRPPPGTVHVSCFDGKGHVGGCTSTSGLAWKIPGRVGDSAIVGAGLYADDGAGSAGSTGRGESNILIAGAHTIVEHLRAGRSPQEACLEALRRVEATCETRLRGPDGKPSFDLAYYALNVAGEYGCAVMRARYREGAFAVSDSRGPRHERAAALYDE